ncbi:MAG TPA: hypothetical protein VNN72_26375 [Polyangiaceae bacterium]|nr:hypothetical protein [Polyangiaceae bacterium]
MVIGRWLVVGAAVAVASAASCSGSKLGQKRAGTGGTAAVGSDGSAGRSAGAGGDEGGEVGLVGGTGGSAGAPAAGGGAGDAAAGRAGALGMSGMGVSGSTVVAGSAGQAGMTQSPPTGWKCEAARFADGHTCDCGCGVRDADCQDATVGSCDTCDDEGACAPGACPGKLDPLNNAACVIPAKWSCAPELYYDGVCNCGCGVLDVDCEGPNWDQCDNCPSSSCTPFDCASVIGDNNAICATTPLFWRCDPTSYNDGKVCDCGCGYYDPDCLANHIDACERCNLDGACSGQVCPGTIDPTKVAYCEHPDAPPGWICEKARYADGIDCDCGCGIADPDCKTAKVEECDSCLNCSEYGCNRIDPEDSTHCLPPADGWTCSPFIYADTVCDCGCGVRDPDCTIEVPGYCTRCPDDSCAQGDCSRLNPADEAHCREN